MKVAELKPAAYNPRRISETQLAALGRALREFGDLGGIVVNTTTGNLVGGHQRVKHLDRSWTITKTTIQDTTGTVARGYVDTPWGRLDYREVAWPALKEKAANLAANKHGGDFDLGKVGDMLGELGAAGLDLDLTGFLGRERVQLLEKSAANRGEDDAPAVPTKAVTKLGDLLELGEHRVVCGDATDVKAWARLRAAGASEAAVVFTDPPYGVSYQAKSGAFGVIEGDRKRGEDLLKMLVGAFKHAVKAARATAAWYVWHASSTREDFAYALKAAGLRENQYLIWAKPGVVLGHSDYRWAHEPCFYASQADHKPDFYGDRAQPTVWRFARHHADAVATVVGSGLLLQDGRGGGLYVLPRAPKGKKARALRLEEGQAAVLAGGTTEAETLWEVGKDHLYQHPTQKPVELARRALENSSQRGQVVLDMFLGSGTTLIGAELTGRRCFGFELDPKYADVIAARWEKITGQKAIRRRA